MGSEITFYDFLDDAGNSVITSWFNQYEKRVKARFDSKMAYLQATSIGMWSTDICKPLQERGDDCKGLFEIRVPYGRIQYRLLGTLGPTTGTATLLFGAIEKENRFVPLTTCKQAQARKATLEADPKRHRRLYEFGSED